MTTLDPVREELLRTDETFQGLYQDHLDSKAKLDELRAKLAPSDKDEAEMKRLKLHKLSLKDQMEFIVHQHSHNQVHA